MTSYTKVYIGMDTYKLLDYINRDNLKSFLDLCSGSGILGMSLCKDANQVVAVEIDEETYSVCKINILLNELESKMDVRKGNLYDVLKKEELFDCIVSNPPYVAVPSNISFPLCASAGEDGLDVLKKILNEMKKWLKPDGRMYLVLESLGDNNEPYVNHLLKNNNCSITEIQISRRNVKYQSEIYSDILAKSDLEKNYQYYLDVWRNFYTKMETTFVYFVLLELINNCKSSFQIMSSVLPYTFDSEFGILEGVVLEQYNEKFLISNGTIYSGSLVKTKI